MRKMCFALAGALALVGSSACSDDDDNLDPDAGMDDGGSGGGNEDASSSGGNEDASSNGGNEDASTGDEDGGNEDSGNGDDALAAVTEVGAFSFTEANDLSAVTYASNGTIYAAGYTDDDGDGDTDDDRSLVVMRFTGDGALDTSFSDDGVVVQDLAVDGRDAGRAIVELADGNVVVAAEMADGNDGQNVVLVKLDDDGEPVTDFGDDGVLLVTFGWAEEDDAMWPEDGAPIDAAYDLEIDDSGDEQKLVVMGYGSAPYDAEADTQRVDDDRYIVRLMADGSADTSFNGDGSTFAWDNGLGIEDDTRRGMVESDGTIVSAGYTEFPDAMDLNNVVLLRLTPDGTLDDSFGFGFDSSPDGATKFNPFEDDGGMAEAYGVGQQSDGTYVTTGYGYATEPTTGSSSMGYVTTTEEDLVTFGVLADGTGLSPNYGKDDSGAWAYQSEELAGDSTEDRGRNLVVLADDRVAHVGYFGAVAAIYITLPDGSLDTDQGDDGRFLFEDDTLTQQFFDVALSPDGKRIAATTRGFDGGARLAILEIADD